ncbi:MAG: hypothetical protein LBR53_06385 [Deltaproteobacteria bacterium]|jgi:hypothetical protein|nr:hypothetical protein [Deltaproteobacteria bacterium]
MTTHLKILALPLIIIIALAGYSYLLSRENSRLEADLDSARAAITSLRKSLASQYKALSERQAEIEAVRAEREADDVKYEDLKKTDPDVCAWSATPIPGPVLEFLCQN